MFTVEKVRDAFTKILIITWKKNGQFLGKEGMDEKINKHEGNKTLFLYTRHRCPLLASPDHLEEKKTE